MGFKVGKSIKSIGTFAAAPLTVGTALIGAKGLGSIFGPKKIPGVPGLSAEEQMILGQMASEGRISQRLSGLYNSDGSINEEALAKAKADLDVQLADEARIYGLEKQTYENALKGDVPISPYLQGERNNAFARLKEQAGRQGVDIQGGTLEEATSNSTSGNSMLAALRQQFDAQKETQRQRYLDFGAQRLGQLRPNVERSLGFVNNATSAYAGMLPSYQGQRELGFQRNIQNAANKNQFRSDLMGLGGTLAGAAIAGPWGAAAGRQAGQMMAGNDPTGRNYSMGFGRNNYMASNPLRLS